ncbi:hypothetical protein DASC09_014060 [Saccharomycopsis crataegensis]|uniref:Uncharacterized protein n=1 Tax=Saccharomycopsis crataegensis TaxID=43959 RepID=A0AAV5QHI5_9ASCO|nr:hypothetical protein DASC09_014060 [Saccharomycopsis crataegensis]
MPYSKKPNYTKFNEKHDYDARCKERRQSTTCPSSPPEFTLSRSSSTNSSSVSFVFPEKHC